MYSYPLSLLLFFLFSLFRTSHSLIHILNIIDSSSLLSSYIKVFSIIRSAKNKHSLSFHFLVLDDTPLPFLEEMYGSCFPSPSSSSSSTSSSSSSYSRFRFQFKKWTRPASLPVLSGEGFDADYIYCRIYLPEIFHEVDRYIYLDNDQVVNMDMEELFFTPLVTGAHPLTSRSKKRPSTASSLLTRRERSRDRYRMGRGSIAEQVKKEVVMGFVFDVNEKLRGYVENGFNHSSPLYIEAMSHIEPAKFFNGGVALVNAKKWRAEGMTQKAEKIIQDNSDGLLYNRRSLGDQGLFFLLLHEGMAELHPAYNMRRVPNKTTRFMKDTLGIVHFAGTTHGNPRTICIDPLQYPHLRMGAVPLYLSVVKSFFDSCPMFDAGWTAVRDTCAEAINKTLDFQRQGMLKVDYLAGRGRFSWPPK